jgi:hypothetical protein
VVFGEIFLFFEKGLFYIGLFLASENSNSDGYILNWSAKELEFSFYCVFRLLVNYENLF